MMVRALQADGGECVYVVWEREIEEAKEKEEVKGGRHLSHCPCFFNCSRMNIDSKQRKREESGVVLPENLKK